MTRTGTALLLLLHAGCTGPRTFAEPASFAQPAARRAERLAPDLFARAERARDDARDAQDASVRADHLQRAELLLAAAIAEAERIERESELRALETEEATLVQKRAALTQERLEVERELSRRQTARRLRGELEHAKALAQKPASAPGKTRSEREQAQRNAAQVLLDHASLLLSTARALALPAERFSALEQRLAQARVEKTTGKALAAAQRLVLELERELPGP
jgi:hypothetical protein